jgi:hypothetical protein
VALHQRLSAAFAAAAGVEAVTPAEVVYISDSTSRSDFVPERKQNERHQDEDEDYNVVGNNFFETLGIPTVAGAASDRRILRRH